jgi:hypothetical protein
MGSYIVSADQNAADGRLSAVWADPAPLFVYGSLLFPEVMRILIGRDPERTPRGDQRVERCRHSRKDVSRTYARPPIRGARSPY